MIGSQANDLSADAPTPIDRVRQIEAHFQKTGAFSNGLVTEGQLPSVSGHSSSRIRNLLTAKQMLGDDEQYAVSMSLMLRHLGIPSRVVMGFYPDPTSPENGAGEVKITGKDVHAWVEVAFDRVGWVSFDPTPPKDNIPIPPDPENKSKPKPQVLQPPPPPQEPVDLPTDSSPDALDADEKKDNPWLFWGALLGALGVALIPLAILALPLLLIALLKSRRRKARFTRGAPCAAGRRRLERGPEPCDRHGCRHRHPFNPPRKRGRGCGGLPCHGTDHHHAGAPGGCVHLRAGPAHARKKSGSTGPSWTAR